MAKLETPFGNFDIHIDGVSIPYTAQKRVGYERLCPNLLGRYLISVFFTPDGKKHEISCTFSPCCSYLSDYESGESLECQSFYNAQRYKMSIGLKGESGYLLDGKRFTDYDYDVEYLKNGMAYRILEETKTDHYVFGIAWIDQIDREDPNDNKPSREVETWFGADPSYFEENDSGTLGKGN